MVRVKTRWLLLRLDFEDHFGVIQSQQDTEHQTMASPNHDSGGARDFPSRKEVYVAVRGSHAHNFGVAGGTTDIQVRWADPRTRLVLIRIPRADFCKVRATLTLMTSMTRRRLVVSILSVNGGARTAKRSAIQHVRSAYQRYFRQQQQQSQTNTISPQTRKDCAVLEQTLSALHAIDF